MNTLTSQNPVKHFSLWLMKIVELAKCGREVALEHPIKYKNFVKLKRVLILIIADREDIIREG